MKHKYFIVFLISVLCIFGITACSGSSDSKSTSNSQSSTSVSEVQEVVVPDVVGVSCDEAETTLWALNLEIETKADDGSDVSNVSGWIVTTQNPAAGSSVKEGDVIKLVVTRGEATVPDVVGKSGRAAKDELEIVGLEADFTSDNGKTVINTSNWTVVSQEPAAGEVVKGGSMVTLVVTKNSDEEKSKEDNSTESGTEEQKEENQEEAKQDNGATLAQKNAVSKAKDYLAFTAFSYSGLIGQLEYEGFTTEEATYGADNCGADWNEQAAKKAQEYLDFTSFSHSGLVDQLVYEGFSYEEAEYGVSATGL